ncbi:hypothetical protein SGFS_065260 [Streptomyces graminofaciens]|uniref:Uncharacterized protein n=1 Tax=Streptomyces graminofaciens TaxID=68212 RepID=A0ABN5VP34_9ACTN|nr:hypothetical protein [Streptomyces graminofaciens]BBC35232.1 hypothetical protein SGFS_065260 [Streptomyces graminofaciens]
MTTQQNFLGIPVQGDITRGSDRVEQKPIEELQPILQAVLDDPTIVEFGWRQYTPYFNDGEPCTFSAHGTWVRTTADEDADEDELEMWGHRTLGKVTGHRDASTGEWVTDPYEGPDEARYLRCKELEKAVEGGAFEVVLLEAFGDHAEITVRRDGIQIEFYSHD